MANALNSIRLLVVGALVLSLWGCATIEAEQRFCDESPDRAETEKALAAIGRGERSVTLSTGAANFYSRCRNLYDPMREDAFDVVIAWPSVEEVGVWLGLAAWPCRRGSCRVGGSELPNKYIWQMIP